MKCGWLIIVCLWAIYFSECSCKRVVIKFDPNFGNGGDIASSFGTIKRELPNYSGFAVEIADSVDINQILANDNVYSVEEDPLGFGGTLPEGYNDPLISNQWALSALQAGVAWELHSVGTEEVVVAICDSGYNFNHEDLPSDMIKGPDYVNDDMDPEDDHSHGTHVAGVIVASTNNSLGIAGFAFNVKLWIGKVLNSGNTGFYSDFAACIDDATDAGVDIISLSLVGGSYNQDLEMSVNNSVAAGVLVVACGGNSGSGPVYPGAFENSFSVGSVDESLERSGFSNIAPHQDIMAPGGNIYSTVLGTNGYGYKSGCSMATPYASAVAALIKSAKPSLTNTELRALMEKTATDLGSPGKDESYGAGFVNPVLALKYALNQPPVISSNSYETIQNKTLNITILCTGPEAYDSCNLEVSNLPVFLTMEQLSNSTVLIVGDVLEIGEFSFDILAVDNFDGTLETVFLLTVSAVEPSEVPIATISPAVSKAPLQQMWPLISLFTITLMVQ
jgi:subtilisin family serine protease